MASGDNWCKEETQSFLHKEALKVLKKIESGNRGKRFILVKVCDHPLTYVEKEIELKQKL